MNYLSEKHMHQYFLLFIMRDCAYMQDPIRALKRLKEATVASESKEYYNIGGMDDLY